VLITVHFLVCTSCSHFTIHNSHTVWDIYLICLQLVYRFYVYFHVPVFVLANIWFIEVNDCYLYVKSFEMSLFPIENALAVAVDALVVGVPRTSQGQPGTFNFM